MRHVLAEQPRLHGAAIGPQAVLQQRRTHHAALPGLLAPVQRGDDSGIEAGGAGMIAHARHRAGRHRVGIRPHQIHQAGARPIRGRIEAGLRRFLTFLAVGGERRVDQPRIQRHQIAPAPASADRAPAAESW